MPSFSGAHKGTKSQAVASPLCSQGPTGGQKCWVNRAFSRVPIQGDKITSGCLNPPFSGPTGGWKYYVDLAFSGVPKQRDKMTSGCRTPAFSGERRQW